MWWSFFGIFVSLRQVSRRRRCFRWQRQRRWIRWRWGRCHASHADCSGRSRLKAVEAAVGGIAWKNAAYESLKTDYAVAPAFWNCQARVSAPPIRSLQISRNPSNPSKRYLQISTVAIHHVFVWSESVILDTLLFRPNNAVENKNHYHYNHHDMSKSRSEPKSKSKSESPSWPWQ